MIKEIKYQGISSIPSDYECADGTMDAAINIIPEDGQLKPLFQPKSLATLPQNYRVSYIHTTAQYTHYIVQYIPQIIPQTPKLYFTFDISSLNSESSIRQHQIALPEDYSFASINITSVGNTLILSTNAGLFYYLFKTNSYSYLGHHLPELPLSFSLFGKQVRDKQQHTIDTSSDLTLYTSDFLPTDNNPIVKINNKGTQQLITDSVMPHVLKFINDFSVEEGKFLFPFFVRYAFRMFDGSLVMHSSPVLMTTASDTTPKLFIRNWNFHTPISQQCIHSIEYYIQALAFDLEYQLLDESFKSELLRWSDIITSVDIFISAPIYTFKQSANIESWSHKSADKKGFSLSRLSFDYVSQQNNPQTYYKSFLSAQASYLPNVKYNESNAGGNAYWGVDEIDLPSNIDNAERLISDAVNFYLFKSLSLEEISTTRVSIPMPANYLSSLTSRELMSDDYDSHDTLIPSMTHIYNSRLHLANITKQFSYPLPPTSYVPFCNDIKIYDEAANRDHNGYIPYQGDTTTFYRIFLCAKNNYQDIVLSPSNNNFNSALYNLSKYQINTFYSSPFIYLYHNNPNIFKIVVCQYLNMEQLINGDPDFIFEHPTRRSDFLNGSIFFDTFHSEIPPLQPSPETIPVPTTDTHLLSQPLSNKLYVSDVNNPFFFPVTSINTIGSGTILAIASANRPLSQGQFGQFPLYAFCSDGVWALQVTQTGSYASIQPITRDVCSNPSSITSTDSEVLFATQRGIMLLSGSSSTCITDAIATQYPFNILSSLPQADTLHSMIMLNNTPVLPIKPFLEFLANCNIIYDYLHQHIFLSNPYTNYSYVLSLKSKSWSIAFNDIRQPINSYPDALAMSKHNHLVSFSSTDQESAKCLLVSRPIKLNVPDVLKTITSLTQRGTFQNGKVHTVLYGSRDLIHWHIITSSANHKLRSIHGSGYKYFRIASVAELKPDETVSGATIDFTPKLLNHDK